MDDKAKSLCIAMAIKKKNKKAHGGLISDEAQMEDLGKNLIAESRRERNRLRPKRNPSREPDVNDKSVDGYRT